MFPPFYWIFAIYLLILSTGAKSDSINATTNPVMTENTNSSLEHILSKNLLAIGETTNKLNTQLLESNERLNQDIKRLTKELEFVRARNERLEKQTHSCNTPSTCTEALSCGGEDGVYKLHMFNHTHHNESIVLTAYCLRDINDCNAWTLIQRRMDGTVDFYRSYNDYKIGFGDLSGEFFIGLDKLYFLTNMHQTTELWIKLVDFQGNVRKAKYSNFKVGGPSTNYTLKSLGVFLGDAGDSMKRHLGAAFSARDSTNKCAETFKGGWWYVNCHDSNLNGLYFKGPHSSFGQGIEWTTWLGAYYSLKYVHLAIRGSD